MVGAAIAIIVVPFFGAMCDRFGSRNVIMTGGAFSAIYAFIFLKLLESGTDLNAYIALAIGTGILAPMMFAAQGSFLSRQFPPEAPQVWALLASWAQLLPVALRHLGHCR